MNISLKAGLKYIFKSCKHEDISYIEALRMYDRIKMDSEAFEYFINKKNENLQMLSIFSDMGRE
jgi:hypothetical protein